MGSAGVGVSAVTVGAVTVGAGFGVSDGFFFLSYAGSLPLPGLALWNSHNWSSQPFKSLAGYYVGVS